jgi:hypothetical protein
MGWLVPVPDSLIGITQLLPETVIYEFFIPGSMEHVAWMAILFVELCYVLLLAFSLFFLLRPVFRRGSRSVRRLPAFSSGLILLTFLLHSGTLRLPAFDDRERPFEVLELSVQEPADRYKERPKLIFQVQFSSLPKEDTIYAIRYHAYESDRVQEEDKVGAWNHISYLEKRGDTIYGMKPGTNVRDHEFVPQGPVSGSIEFAPSRPPNYFVVFVDEMKPKNRFAYGTAYKVRIESATP